MTNTNQPSTDIILVGKKRVIAVARDANGNALALAFLDNVDRTELKKLREAFSIVADNGEVGVNRKRFKHEVGALFAFKGWQARVAAFRIGDTWLLTHGFVKKVDQWPDAEIARAFRIMAEHLARTRPKR